LDGWLTWIILGLALMGFEMVTPGFVIMWFGVGALVAAAMAFFGFSLTVQLLSFLISTVLLLAYTRKMAVKIKGQDVHTNYSALVGKTAVVTQQIYAQSGLGVVKVLGEEWSALAETERDLAPGEKVTVMGVSGVRLVVQSTLLVTQHKEEGF